MNAKDIRNVARILGMKPDVIITLLATEAQKSKTQIIKQLVESEKSEVKCFSDKITELAKILGKTDSKDLIQDFSKSAHSSTISKLQMLGLGILFLIMAIISFVVITLLLNNLSDHFTTIIITIYVVLAIGLIIVIPIFIWNLYKAIYNLNTAEFQERKAIEEIVKIMKLIDDDFQD